MEWDARHPVLDRLAVVALVLEVLATGSKTLGSGDDCGARRARHPAAPTRIALVGWRPRAVRLAMLVKDEYALLGRAETLGREYRDGVGERFAARASGPLGRSHAVGELWAALGIGKAISRVAGSGRGRSGVERAIFTPCVWRSRRRPGPGSARHGATGTSTDGGGRARTSTPHGLGVGPVTIVHSRWTATTRWRSSTPLGTWTASTRGSRPSDVRRGRRTIRRPDIVWHVRDWEARMADVPSEIRGPSVA
jgi:hypothetical protein